MDLKSKFLKYVEYETTSIEDSEKFPSNDLEYLLLNELKDELTGLGLDAFIKDGYVYSKINSDCGKEDTIFLMAHVDTSPDASGKSIKPRTVKYDGTPITLCEGKVLSEDVFEGLKNHRGHELIVTDGSTLLGADDKAGVAIIMETVERILKCGNYPNIIVCFSPDEEIGKGTDKIDIDWILSSSGKIYAYTIDGGDIEKFNYECFNAASATFAVDGVSIHPSIGKNKLVNAQELVQECHRMLPLCRPENTSDREGFIHLVGIEGQTEHAEFHYILRSFDRCELESYKKHFYGIKDFMNKKYGKEFVDVKISDSYNNMYEVVEKNRHVINLVEDTYKEMGIKLEVEPIRGGTDGANLSFMGLPCPNLGTGGDNFHGVYEYVDYDQMKMMVEILLKMISKLNWYK